VEAIAFRAISVSEDFHWYSRWSGIEIREGSRDNFFGNAMIVQRLAGVMSQGAGDFISL